MKSKYSAEEMEYQNERYGRVNYSILLLFTVFFVVMNLSQSSLVFNVGPLVIYVFSVGSHNPLHMVVGKSSYVTSQITEGKILKSKGHVLVIAYYLEEDNFIYLSITFVFFYLLQ